MSQLANGAFVVAWTHQRAVGGPRILGQIFHPDGSKSGGEFKINTNTAPQKCDIAVTGLSDGLSTGKGFVGAWVVARPLQGGTEVRAQIFNFDGSRVDDFETFIIGETQG